LTTARYYTPSGRSIQAQGIVPDIKLERGEFKPILEPELDPLKEADLSNHLDGSDSNGTDVKPADSKPDSDKEADGGKKSDGGKKTEAPAKALVAEDYQLAEALNMLKGSTSLAASRPTEQDRAPNLRSRQHRGGSRCPRVLIPLAEGFEELEAVTIIDLLRRADIEVVSAGLEPGPVTGSRRTVLVPDSSLDAVIATAFDMVVLPGGLTGAANLEGDPRVRALLRRQDSEGASRRPSAPPAGAGQCRAARRALCNAYPGTLRIKDFPRVNLIEDPVVIDAGW